MNDAVANAIEVHGLTKRFGEVQAGADASFEVLQGELFGFLGPNGAGKTTTINMLIGLARPDTGRIRIAGIDCGGNPKAAQQLAVSNLEPALPGKLVEAFANMIFKAPAGGMIRVEADEPIRVGPLVRFLEDQGAGVNEARRMQPSLEDVFVKITGIEADAMRKEKEKKGGGRP